MSKRYVILACDNNPEYRQCLQLVKWAWQKVGWEAIVLEPFETTEYRSATIAQVMRLYASALDMFEPDDILMTSDADMVPLTNYWNPDPNVITVFGHDLTDFNHVPMMYIAMTKTKWREVMNITGNDLRAMMERDLPHTNAKSDVFFEWWHVDQDIITDRLKAFPFVNIKRGTSAKNRNYPTGRVDRANNCLILDDQLIDFHLPRNMKANINKIRAVINTSFGGWPKWL